MRSDEICAWAAITSVGVLFIAALTGQGWLTIISAFFALAFGALALRDSV